MTPPDELAQCLKDVWRKDTYRYSGGKHHFKMHYQKGQCLRRAKKAGFCFFHYNREVWSGRIKP